MEIVTRRFVLRDPVEADRPAFLAYQADSRMHAFHGPGEALDGHDLFDTFLEWASESPRQNYQLLIVQRYEPRALVGCCGLRGAGPGQMDLGIELAPNYWGRYGYAVEVGRALLEVGFDDLGLDVITGSTVSANDRITRLAEWFGAEVGVTRPGPAWMDARGWHEVEWRITRDRWTSSNSDGSIREGGTELL